MISPRPLGIAALVSAVILLIGSIGPWATFMGASVSGMDGDGVITLILAIVGAAAGGLVLGPAKPGSIARWFVLPAGLIALLVAIIDIVDVGTTGAEFGDFSPSIGWGLWLVLISSIALTVVGALLALAKFTVSPAVGYAAPGGFPPPGGYAPPVQGGYASPGPPTPSAPAPPAAPEPPADEDPSNQAPPPPPA